MIVITCILTDIHTQLDHSFQGASNLSCWVPLQYLKYKGMILNLHNF